MPRRAISDDLAGRAASLRRSGQSYRAIGAALGVDPRTAKSLANRGAAENQGDHWERVEERVDSQLLDEHFRLLLYTWSGVSWAVETHPRNTTSTLESEYWLAHQVGTALAQAKDLLAMRGITTDPGLDKDPVISQRVSGLLLEGLKEHEPTLAALDGPGGWTKQWKRFQRSRQKLIDQACILLVQRAYGEETATSMAESAVEALIHQGRDGRAVGQAGDQQPSREIQVSDDYQWVLAQISQPQRGRDLRESGAAVAEAASRVERAVVELQLRGRPGGRCSLCPSRVMV